CYAIVVARDCQPGPMGGGIVCALALFFIAFGWRARRPLRARKSFPGWRCCVRSCLDLVWTCAVGLVTHHRARRAGRGRGLARAWQPGADQRFFPGRQAGARHWYLVRVHSDYGGNRPCLGWLARRTRVLALGLLY